MRCTSCGSRIQTANGSAVTAGRRLATAVRGAVSRILPVRNFVATAAPISPSQRLLRGQPSPSPPVVGENGEPREVPKGERRHLTVLFCDLVGSTEMAGHLDPEQWRNTSRIPSCAAQAIERFGRHVAQESNSYAHCSS